MVLVWHRRQFGLSQSLPFHGSLFVRMSSIFCPDLSTTLILSPVVSYSLFSLSLNTLASSLPLVCGTNMTDFITGLSPTLSNLFLPLFQDAGALLAVYAR